MLLDRNRSDKVHFWKHHYAQKRSRTVLENRLLRRATFTGGGTQAGVPV